jgi:hypothetical protein
MHINISALTILIDYGYPERLIVKYYQNLAKFIERYKIKYNDDIYNYRKQLIAEYERIHNSELERLARQKEEETNDADFKRKLKIVFVPFVFMLAYFVISGIKTDEQEKIQDANRNLAQIYGGAVKKAFEQAATEGDSATTVAELSDNAGKKYLSPELNYQGKKFYISDIEGFESYALLDSANMCGKYSYAYDELVNRVKKYKFTDGCYDGKYFYMVKPVYTEEEKTTHDLQEELKKMRTEIEALKTNNR